MEELLKQIVNHTEPKRSFSIVVSDNKTRFKTWFKPPIRLEKKERLWNSAHQSGDVLLISNIDNSNNCFPYIPCANALWYNIIISEGSYHVEDINDSIQQEIRKNCHNDKANDKDNIEISANTNTLKSEMFLRNNYDVDFRQYNSINSLLWFHTILYTSGFHESENMVNILNINIILVDIDIISR